jgi:UDP-N-acetylglucosamine--N-acetylmuramyl-(pentapeptide) pyrophosphoryl-undecaprenol N-acetylglucosamine transferase
MITGGGTGGHVYPGVAVAREFVARDPANEVLFVGGDRGVETVVVPREGFALRTLSVTGIKGKGLGAMIGSLARLAKAVVVARSILADWRPDAVLGVGGYASGPVGLAALSKGIPLYLAEQNGAPGMTNRWLAKGARTVFVAWPGSEAAFPVGKAVVTGNPIRADFFTATRPGRDERLSILVVGGSLGARTLNETFVAAVDRLNRVADKIAVVHQTGSADYEWVAAGYAAALYPHETAPFLHDMPERLAAADLVVCRAGAGVMAEIAAAGRAALYVPYPFAADDHQTRNAEVMVNAAAADMVADARFTADAVVDAVDRALADRRRLARMGEAARTMARPAAAAAIVDRIVERRAA